MWLICDREPNNMEKKKKKKKNTKQSDVIFFFLPSKMREDIQSSVEIHVVIWFLQFGFYIYGV